MIQKKNPEETQNTVNLTAMFIIQWYYFKER